MRDSTAQATSGMSEALLRLDDLSLPGHPITDFGKAVAAFIQYAESAEGNALVGEARAKFQAFAASATLRQQEAKAGLIVKVFGKSEAQERADFEERRNAALGAGLAIDGLKRLATKWLAYVAQRREQSASRRVVWDLLRYAAHDSSGSIPLHIDFQLFAMPKRLRASPKEMASLSSLPIPTRHSALEPMTEDYPLELRLQVGQLAAFITKLNEHAPGSLRARDLESFMTSYLALQPEQAAWVQRQAKENYSSNIADLSSLVGTTVQCFVDSAAVIRTKGLTLHVDEICDVADRVGAFDPLRAERENRRRMAAAAIRAAGPLLAKHATKHMARDLEPHLRSAAADGAHKVAKALLDAGVTDGNRALIVELERRSQVGWSSSPTKDTKQFAYRPPAAAKPRSAVSSGGSTTTQRRMRVSGGPATSRSVPWELVNVSDRGEFLAYRLSDSFVIGRGNDCDLQLPDTAVSRRHVRIFAASGGLWIEDLNSGNGTILNDEPLAPSEPVRLRAYDEIVVGSMVFTFKRVKG